MQETFDDILKAQTIYRKMITCTAPQDFKKVFSDSIGQHTLDEFYPVVVRAELSAILTLSHQEKAQKDFNFDDYIAHHFGLKPQDLIGMGTQAVADIMEKDIQTVEAMFRGLGYTVENGKTTHYGDNRAGAKIVQLAERRKAAS